MRGFSRMARTLPSSPMSSTPSEMGTWRVRVATVSSAPLARCARCRAPKSTAVSTSQFITSAGESQSRTSRSGPAVPSGVTSWQ